VLINGGSGIAVGFASNILNRDIKEVVDACQKVLQGKNITTLKPHSNYFFGDYIQDSDNPKRWIIRGKFQRINTTTIKITELPPSLTYEKYEEILDKLVDNKTILSYDDNCKDNIEYIIKFTRVDLEKLDDDKLIKMLKLEEFETENLTTLDENGKLKIFDCALDIIKYFVNFRLQYYQKRKDFLLNKLEQDVRTLGNRGKFIKLILDGKIKINNKPKTEIINQIELFKLDKIDGDYDYLLRMPISSLTSENFEKLKSDFKLKKEEIDNLSQLNTKDMYLMDLSEFKKTLKY